MCLGTAWTSVLILYLLLECRQVATEQDKCPASKLEFNFTVNESSKLVNVFVEPGHSVNVRVGYKTINTSLNTKTKPLFINSSASRRSAVISVPYILPCLCVEVYYMPPSDCMRYLKCPLENATVLDVTDVWPSTNVRLKSNTLRMLYQCPAAEINMSTALCWKHGSYCTVVFYLDTLEEKNGRIREYNISAVDTHPQMCVQRVFRGSLNISCHFEADMSSWMFHVDLRRQSILVYIDSSVPAKFSAQLCKLSKTTCASIGDIQSLNTKQNITMLQLPVLSVEERPCVQVWQSEPALHGKRILCPEYSRGRYGIYAVAILVCGIIVITLGIFFYHMIKKDTAGWFNIQRPVLLVCSSEDSVHISTVCALASILQGDLGATVHLALWAQSTRSHYGMGVTDVGPLPWLYGQWDSVIKAHGNVLIIWSLDAIIAYKDWWSEKESVKSSNQKDSISHISHKMEETATLIGKYRVKKEHAAQRTVVTEPCTVIAPVFKAALTCLMGALQEKNLQQVAFVCLHGHNTRKDIPKSLRAFPCYCLPRQFSELMQELGVKSRLSEKSRFHCWTGLLSKVLCFWVGQQLAKRLQTNEPTQPQGST